MCTGQAQAYPTAAHYWWGLKFRSSNLRISIVIAQYTSFHTLSRQASTRSVAAWRTADFIASELQWSAEYLCTVYMGCSRVIGRSHGVLNYVNTHVILANILKGKRVCAQAPAAVSVRTLVYTHTDARTEAESRNCCASYYVHSAGTSLSHSSALRVGP